MFLNHSISLTIYSTISQITVISVGCLSVDMVFTHQSSAFVLALSSLCGLQRLTLRIPPLWDEKDTFIIVFL